VIIVHKYIMIFSLEDGDEHPGPRRIGSGRTVHRTFIITEGIEFLEAIARGDQNQGDRTPLAQSSLEKARRMPNHTLLASSPDARR
jgi:hypothetical protein